MGTVETGGFQVDRFTMKNFQETGNAWRDRGKWPICMLNILLRVGVHEFVFAQFNFQNEEIDDAICNYGDGAMELPIFGRRVHLDPNLVSRATRIPHKGEQRWLPRKPPG